jgi:outer membrane receptor protein involved in Fe transport
MAGRTIPPHDETVRKNAPKAGEETMKPTASRLATLMGSASFLTLTSFVSAQAQQVAQAQLAQAGPEAVPEQVLVTGSLIHGTAAVGVPVTNLGAQDFTQTGAITIGDLFRTVPEANVAPGPSAVNSGGHQERETRVNIRGLDATGPRSLLMVDGVRHPPQADGLCAIDPSIIPALALDRVDILADGSSATYGSDAIAGVINVILKRNFDGATTLMHVQTPTDGGGTQYQASQLFGRTWEGGDVALTYEWTNEEPVKGTIHSKFTSDFRPWGLEDPAVPIAAAIPGVISTGAPTVATTVPGGGSSVPVLVNGVCTNCWSVPHGTGANFNASLNNGFGPLAPGSAAPFTWASLIANATNQGANNFVDPMKMGWELAAQQKNSVAGTFDQRLLPGISIFAEGYYTNRRVEEALPAFGGQGVQNDLVTVKVPTTNPYYPTGAPANLQVSYDLALEVPPSIPAYEISARYEFGFNLDLPFGWTGQIYDAYTYEEDQATRHFVSKAGVNVALGIPTGGVTKPASVPYLNVFCDPTAFQCNSPTTLGYIAATSTVGARYSIDEKGARFDGTLFSLPGGNVKAAVGGLYDGDYVYGFNGNNQATPGNLVPLQLLADPEPYHIWAEFTQVDIPVFGDNFNIPLVRKLDLEGSFRHDAYGGNPALTGETRNPKVAFTWLLDEVVGATVRGSWGTSFRFANAGEFSTVLSAANQSYNIAGGAGGVTVQCFNGAPSAGSVSQALFATGLFPCGSAPGGEAFGGGPEPALRSYVNAAGVTTTREGGIALAPEKSLNYSFGVELAPQIDFLRGLDLQATWYSVKINGVIAGNLTTNSGTLSDPTQRYHYIVPSDLGCPVAANANPTSCAPFESMVVTALSQPQSTSDLTQVSNVYWINDSGSVNQGFLHVEGVDWNASYDVDLGDLGAWNTGIVGTYYLHRYSETVAGGTIIDQLHQNLSPAGGVQQNGVETLPRMHYRARLGWSDGQFNATMFMNYDSHFYEFRSLIPPNVNLQCTSAGGTIGGGAMPCAISNFNQLQPAYYTFDLSFGYNTGDIPTNDYLKRLTIQLTIQNLMGIHPSSEYGPSSSVRNPGGYNILESDLGRVIGLTLVKNW